MRRFPSLLPALAGLAFLAPRAGAHMLNMYDCDRVFEIRLGRDFVDLRLLYSFREFPSLSERLAMDRDADDLISESEAAAYCRSWLERILAAVELKANGQKLVFQALEDPTLDLYGSQRIIPQHHDLTFELTAGLSLPTDSACRLSFRLNEPAPWPHPGKELLALIAGRNIAVDSASFDIQGTAARPRPYEGFSFTCRGRTEKEIAIAAQSGEAQWRIVKFIQGYYMPQLSSAGQAAPPGSLIGGTAARQAPAEELAAGQPPAGDRKLRQMAMAYLEGGKGGLAALWLLLAAAFIYGCIHALAPGHAKTLTAAYLIGSGSGWPQALLLAAVVTFTHTGSVLILAIATRLAWGQGLSAHTQSVLSGISGLIVLALGIQRLRSRPARSHAHVHEDGSVHVHTDFGEGHSHEHSGPALPADSSPAGYRRIVWLGFAGGLAPCPGALWIYFLALGFGKPGLGIALIISLSLGLSTVLIAVGLATIYFRRALDTRPKAGGSPAGQVRRQVLEVARVRLLELLPAVAGTVLVLVGAYLIFQSLTSLGLI